MKKLGALEIQISPLPLAPVSTFPVSTPPLELALLIGLAPTPAAPRAPPASLTNSRPKKLARTSFSAGADPGNALELVLDTEGAIFEEENEARGD